MNFKLYRKYIKRLFDIILSFCMFVCLSPVMIIISLLIKINLGGPVIFVQQRPGYKETPFDMVKFRTMTDKRDSEGNLLPDSQRMTRFGNMLRDLSLDELPELWNILKGDMSFVGPRPLLMEYLPLYSQEQKKRHDVRPGLTGLAQVNGRNAISWEEKFSYDVAYAENISLWLDLKIFLKTFKKVIVRDGVNNSSDIPMPKFTGNKNIKAQSRFLEKSAF